MAIKVKDARFARGYSGYDHLLDDSPLRSIIGREFATLAAAGRAAERAADGTQDKRCASGPVLITDADGRTWKV